jgi:hypothetical protein
MRIKSAQDDSESFPGSPTQIILAENFPRTALPITAENSEGTAGASLFLRLPTRQEPRISAENDG